MTETQFIVSWDKGQQFAIVFYLLWVQRSLLKSILRLTSVCACVSCCDIINVLMPSG